MSVNLRTIRTLNSWPLCIAPAHSRVGEGALAAAKADRLAAEHLWKKCHRMEETTEKRDVWLHSYIYHSVQGAAIKLVQL